MALPALCIAHTMLWIQNHKFASMALQSVHHTALSILKPLIQTRKDSPKKLLKGGV